MPTTPLTFIATNDLVAHMRGRSVPGTSTDEALRKGVGWVPANLALNAFGDIAENNIFGSAGDLRLVPDPETAIELPAANGRPGVKVLLADQILSDGSPWPCCPRTFAREAIEALAQEGLELVASFEHEFSLLNLPPTAPFSFERLRGAEPFGSDLIQLLEATGLEPENWLPEYAEDQFEVTLKPAPGTVSADRAVLLRELVRDLGARHGLRTSFAPLLEPQGGGNGVHVHLSLRDRETGEPLIYDPLAEAGLSAVGAQFAAGIVRHAPALVALTAASPSSYFRLSPHRWSVGGIFLGERNREALLRICPVNTIGGSSPESQFNLEYRAADGTANPWLVLGSLVRAGLAGIAGRYAPERIWQESASEAEVESSVKALPRSVEEALTAFGSDPQVRGWFDADLAQTYLDVKRSEIAATAGLSPDEICAKVANVY